MNKPKIINAHVVMTVGGDYTYKLDDPANDHARVSGKPSPSEGEAWAFDKGVKVLNKFLFMPYAEQLALLEELKI